MRHYTEARRDTPDGHLLRRSALLAEFALAQYLVKALAAGHSEMTAEAEAMLKSLADDIEQQNALAAEEAEAAAAELAAADALAAPAVVMVSEAAAAEGDSAKPTVSVTAIPESADDDVPAARPETAAATPSVTVAPLGEAATGVAAEDGSGESTNGTAPAPEAPSESDDTSTTALQVVEPAPLQDAKDH
jgi:hypothetical protein